MPEEMSTHSNIKIKNSYQIYASVFNYVRKNKEGKYLKKRP